MGTNIPHDVQISGLALNVLNVYRKCRDCQGEEYHSLANDTRALHNTIQDIEDAIICRQLSQSQQSQLIENIQSCNQLCCDLNAAIDRYNGLPSQSKRTFDRMGWDQSAAKEMSSSLKGNISTLTSFYKSLVESPQAKIERALKQLADDVSSGRHETTSVASLSTVSDFDDDSGWIQIVHDLNDLGVPEAEVHTYKTFIIDWILRAINGGALTEKIPVEQTSEEKVVALEPPPLPPKIPSPIYSGPQSVLPPVDYQSQLARPVTDYHSHERSSSHDNGPSLRLSISQAVLTRERAASMDEPPSPIEPDPSDSNILWTAQRIVEHWEQREWSRARAFLEDQIRVVEEGRYVEINGSPVQPDLRILKHLLGVNYSWSGDFLKAKEAFESVIQGVYVQGLPIDDGDIAAARWLGETCIFLNEPSNAALAWCIAFYGTLNRHPQHMPPNHLTHGILNDIRFLNQKTNGLNGLRNAVVKSNRDISTILMTMPGTDKFHIVLTALEGLAQNMYPGARAIQQSQDIRVAEGFLFQPLFTGNSWPFPSDPFFRSSSSIDLLSVLSRPKQQFVFGSVATSSLGHSKNLNFVTKQPLKWLVEAVRFALNTYAIEWKVQGSMYLIRLSQTHERVAYYDCFGIKFRKLSLRSVHGIKLTEPLYSTRTFNPSRSANSSHMAELQSEIQRKEIVRQELADRLRDYLQQAENDTVAGNWPPEDSPFQQQPYEMEGMAPNAYAELSGAPASVAELPGESRWKRNSEMPQPIAELPAEPYR